MNAKVIIYIIPREPAIDKFKLTENKEEFQGFPP